MSSLLLQSAGEFIHHHFLQLPMSTASNQRKGKMKQEQQYPWSITISSLLCLQSAPSFICSLSGWEEPLLRLQICDSSRHKPGIHCVLAAVPQKTTVYEIQLNIYERQAFEDMTNVALIYLRAHLCSLKWGKITLESCTTY